MAYWTTSEEDKNVYHIYDDCPDGKQIEDENRKEDPVAPAGRVLCARCRSKRDTGEF